MRAGISMNAESTIKTVRRRPAPFTEAGAWRDVGGNVSCTLMHEMGHVLGRPFHTGPVNDNRPDSLGNCCNQNIR